MKLTYRSNLKVLITCLLLVLDLWNLKPTYKYPIGNHGLGNLKPTYKYPIGNHGLGPLHQGQTWEGKLRRAYNWLIIGPTDLQGEPAYRPNLKVLITRLLLVLEFWDLKPTYRKTLAGNLPMWSNLTLGLSFNVKQG